MTSLQVFSDILQNQVFVGVEPSGAVIMSWRGTVATVSVSGLLNGLSDIIAAPFPYVGCASCWVHMGIYSNYVGILASTGLLAHIQTVIPASAKATTPLVRLM